MACADGKAFLRVDYMQEVHQVGVVIERFADTHNHDMADALLFLLSIEMRLHLHDLFDDFAGVQITAFLQ